VDIDGSLEQSQKGFYLPYAISPEDRKLTFPCPRIPKKKIINKGISQPQLSQISKNEKQSNKLLPLSLVSLRVPSTTSHAA
jgi:hypothetical protein